MVAPSYRAANASNYYYGVTTLTLAKPSGTIEGDIMVMWANQNDTTRTLNTLPSGWTQLFNTEEATTPATEMWVAWKKAGASEPASYDFVFSGTFNGCANIEVIKDGDTLHKSAAAAVSAIQTGPYNGTAPSVTTTINDCLLLAIYGCRITTTGAAPTFTEDTGWAEQHLAGNNYENRFAAVATKTLATAGASGAAAGSFVCSGAGDGRTHAFMLAISPAVTSYIARPASDISAGTWTASSGSDLYAMLDEETPSDTDYITASSAGTCEVKLSAITAPPSGWQTKVKVRNLGDNTVKLMCSSTEIASWVYSDASATTHTETLTNGQQASVTDWSDLRLRYIKPA